MTLYYFLQLVKTAPSVEGLYISEDEERQAFSHIPATMLEAMTRQDRTEAFRAAHTLKGVAANLGFSRLTNSASQLTEALRPESAVICQLSPSLMDAVTQDYRATMDAIRAYLG